MIKTSRNIKGLPYQAINSLLIQELKHGVVHLSNKTIRHVMEKHPKDYEVCLGNLELVISKPDFVGQSPLHKENFVVVKKVDEIFIMVAISSIADEYGEYPIMSTYLIPSSTVRRRIRVGYFKMMLPKEV